MPFTPPYLAQVGQSFRSQLQVDKCLIWLGSSGGGAYSSGSDVQREFTGVLRGIQMHESPFSFTATTNHRCKIRFVASQARCSNPLRYGRDVSVDTTRSSSYFCEFRLLGYELTWDRFTSRPSSLDQTSWFH